MAAGDEQGPRRPRGRRRRVVRALGWTAVAVAVLLFAAAFFAAPALEQRPQLLARWLGEYFGRAVTLGGIEILWTDGAPLLRIRDLELGSDDGSGSSFRLDTAELRIDTLRSLRDRSIRPRAVTVRGAHLLLERAPNGVVSIAGIGQQHRANADDRFAALLSALPANALLGIEQATVTLQGFGAAAQATVLSPVSAHLHHGRDGVVLTANAAVQGFAATPVRATVRWPDPASNPLSAAEFTLNTESLPLAALPDPLRSAAIDAQISIAVRGDIADRTIRAVRGTLKLDRLRTTDGAADAPIAALQGLIEYIDTGGGWRLTMLRLQANRAAEPPAPGRLTLSGTRPLAPRTVVLENVPVSTVLPVLRVFGPESVAWSTIAASLTPAGHIDNLQVDLSGDLPTAQVQKMQASVRGIVLQNDRHQVRIGPLAASLRAAGRSGSIRMQTAPVRVDLAAGAARVAQQVNFSAGGTLGWHHDENGLTIDTSALDLADGETRLQATGTLLVAAPPALASLDLQLRGAGLDAATFKRYLALDWLPDGLRDWLSRSIGAGRLRDFRAHLSGPPASADAMLERLTLEAEFEDLTVHYLHGWPQLSAMSGRFSVNGRKFSLQVDSGRVGDARIESTAGQIADVLDPRPVLILQGQARGRAEQGTAFISATPLGAKFSQLLQQLRATGAATLALQLEVPLGEEGIGVRGELTLSKNELRIRALRSALTDVSGTIFFDTQGLTKAQLAARYLQREISMSLDGTLDGRNRTRLTIDGATDPQGLLRHLYDVGALDSDEPAALPLLSRLSGRTKWQVRLDLAQRQAAEPIVTMSVQSDLAGMALNLPPPMGKSMDEARPLKITSTLAGTSSESRQFEVQYGDALHAIVEMAPQQAGGFALHRGALRLGGGRATLTSQPGLSVHGSVALLSVDDWAALIAELEARPGDAAETQRALDHLRRVQVQARRMVALGAVFDDVTLDVSRRDSGQWIIATKGSGIDGSIAIAEPIGLTPIEARFERLHVRREGVEPAAGERPAPITIKPDRIPSARVIVQRLRYNDIELGLSKLVFEPVGEALDLSEIFVLNEAFEIRGTGRWGGSANAPLSRFDLRLHSNDFGQFTKALGYGDSGIEGGVAEIVIDAKWRGSPFEFALDKVEGELHFRGTGGRLRDAEPGATGRVFGLLNLTVLPRRLLLLDFKDLFEEGVSYEVIEGSFALSDGNALTDNVVMDTQTATVALQGRVGLVAQDYDQVMTVTPKMSASLPLAPIWLAEKLLNRKLIDNAFAYQYLITGTWVEPRIERVRVETPKNEPQ